MPVKLERKLKREASMHGYKKGSKQYGAYVFGTIANMEKKRGKKRSKSYNTKKGK